MMRSSCVLLLVVLTIPTAVLGQKSDDAASLSCWGTKASFHSRAARTPLFRSDAGLAYAEVSAKAITDGDVRNCSNTARLFYSTSGSNPKVIWSGHQELNGLGITILGWSQSGTLLLFQTRTWPYDSDANEVHRTYIFDAGSGKVRDLKLTTVFSGVLGTKCEFAQSAVGWRSDTSIIVRVSKAETHGYYEQVFCVKKPIDYIFDLSTGTASPLR